MKAVLVGSLFILAVGCTGAPRSPAVSPVTMAVRHVDREPEDDVAPEPAVVIYEWIAGRCLSQSQPSPEAPCVTVGEIARRPDDYPGRRVRLNAFVSIDDEAHAWLTDGIPPHEKVRVADWWAPPCTRLGHYIVEADVASPAESLVELHRAVAIGVADGKTNCDVAPCRSGEGCPER